MFRRIGLAVLLVVGAATPAHAQAQARALPRTVAVSVPDCPDEVGWGAVLARLEVELRGLDVGLVRDGRDAEARLVLSLPGCDLDGPELDVLLVRPASERSLASRIALPAVERSDRPRVIALALAEAVRRDWPALAPPVEARMQALEAATAELGDTAQTLRGEQERRATEHAAQGRRIDALDAALAAAADRVEALEAARAPEPPALVVSASATGWVLPNGGVGLVGIRLAGEVRAGPLRIQVSADGAGSAVVREPGTIATGFALAGASVMAPWQAGPVFVSVGVGGRLGWAFAEGQPLDPTRFRGGRGDAAFGTLSAQAALHVPIEDIFGRVELEVGYALGGLDAQLDDRTLIQLGGPVVSLAIGLELEP